MLVNHTQTTMCTIPISLTATKSMSRWSAEAEKLATFDIDKDEKFAYLKELMRLEKKRHRYTKIDGEKPEKAKFRRKSLAVL